MHSLCHQLTNFLAFLTEPLTHDFSSITPRLSQQHPKTIREMQSHAFQQRNLEIKVLLALIAI
jgi:hypothetical protein